MPVFHSNVQVIRTVCDEQLLLSIQTTLIDGVTLNMGEVNDAYLLILKRYQVEVDEKTNYRKHLKQLITEHLPNTQFVKSFRKIEPDNIVLPKTVSKAIDIHPLKNSLLYTLFKVKDPPVIAPNWDFWKVIDEVLVTDSGMDGEGRPIERGVWTVCWNRTFLFSQMIHLAITPSVVD